MKNPSRIPNRFRDFLPAWSPTRWCVLLACAGLIPAPEIQATPRTWSGGGADNNWGTAINWGGTAPVAGDSLVFAGSTRVTNFNNLTSLSLTGISFQNSGFLFGGNPITNRGGIYDNSGNNTNNLPTYLSGSQGITNAAAGTVLQLGGLQTNLAGGNVLTFGGPGNIYVAGVISGQAAVNANGDGAGKGFVRLSAANTFTGPLTVNSGTLQLANAAAIPGGNGKGDVSILNATLDLNGNSQTINGLNGNHSSVVDNRSGTATYTLTVGDNATNGGGSFEFDGTIQNTTGTIALTKLSTNVFLLGGSATYGGPTTISAGALVLTNLASIASSSAFDVAVGAQLNYAHGSFSLSSGQTLSAGRATNNGPADLVGDFNNAGGTITIYRAGQVGTLTVNGGLTLGGGLVSFDLGNNPSAGAGSNDLIAINGPLNENGGTILLNPVAGTFANQSYTLITNQTTLVSGTAAGLTVATPRGLAATLDDSSFPGSLLVNITGSSAPLTDLWVGANNGGVWDVNATQNVNTNGGLTTFFNLDNMVFNDSASNTTVNVAAGVSPSATLVNNTLSDYVFAGSGAIGGAGGLTKTGPGSLTVRNQNFYTGPTVVNQGLLTIDFANSSPVLSQIFSASSPLVLGGGTLALSNAKGAANAQVFNGTTVAPGASLVAIVRNTGASLLFTFGTITRKVGGTLYSELPSGGAGVGAVTTSPLVNGILGGYCAGEMNHSTAVPFPDQWLAKNTANQLVEYVHLAQEQGANAFTNPTNNVEIFPANLAPGANSVVNSLHFDANSTGLTLTLSGTNVLASGGLLVSATTGSATETITGGTLLGATNADLIVFQDSPGTLVIDSTIADNTNLAAAGGSALTLAGGPTTGTLVLTRNNTYTGPTFVAAGTLQVGNGGASGGISRSSGVTNFGTLAFDRSDAISFGSPILGYGSLQQAGNGILTLTTDNSYSGSTWISAGTLQVGAGAAAGSLGGTASITNQATLVFDRPDAVVINAPINGAGTLVNSGAGTLTLNNPNAFAGLITISNGAVALGAAAALPDCSGIVLASPASVLDVSALSGGITLAGGSVAQVLAGDGTVNGSVTVTNNTTLTPGTNGVVGTLTINHDLTLAGGTLNVDVGASSMDLVVVGGTLGFNAGTIVLNTLNPLPNGAYKLIGYGGFNGSAANVSLAGFSSDGQLAFLTNNAARQEIDLVVSSSPGASLIWVGDGVNNFWDVATSSDWNNGPGAALFFNNDNVTFDDSSVNPVVVLNAADLPASMTINTLANNYTFTGSGSVSGRGSLVINATNTTVTVDAAFNNSGPTVINTGILQVGDGSHQGALGTGAVTNQGIINFNEPANAIFGGALAGSGSLYQQAPTVLALQGDNRAYQGPITINAGVIDVGGGTGSGSLGAGLVTNNGTLLVDLTGTGHVINNNITGRGPVAFINGGTVSYGGNNTYANNTYVSNGVVELGSATAIPADGGAGDWLVLDGAASGSAGTLDLNGFDLSVNALSGVNAAQNGLIENNGGSGVNTLSIIGSAATTYSGTIQDNSGGGGQVALFVGAAASQTIDVESLMGNTYTGGTVISNGAVHLTASSAIGNAVGLGTGPVTLLSNATLYAVGATGNNAPAWNSLANTIAIPAGQTAAIYGPQHGAMQANITGGGTLFYHTAYVRGQIGGNWSGFTGQAVVGLATSGGNLGLNNTAGFGHLFLTNNLGTSGPGSGVFLYNLVTGTPTIPIGELADDGSSTIESTNSGNAGGVAASFAVGGLNTSTNYGGNIIDDVGLIKVGAGVWTLTGATLSYSGPTTVSNGVLALGADSSLPNSTPITLAAGGTLDVSASGTLTLAAQTLQGNGTLNGSLLANAGSTVSPGGANAIGTLTVTNQVTLGGTLLLELNRTNSPATNDLLVAGAISAGGTLQVNNLGPDLHSGDTFKLFSVPVAGAFAVTNLPATSGDGSIAYVWSNHLALDGAISLLVGVPNVNTTPTNLTATFSNGTLILAWPADHTGWRLLVQANNLAVGLAANTNDWVTVAGSASVNQTNLPLDPASPAAFYRLVYP
jgi:autotransporter-associated beta strand protein